MNTTTHKRKGKKGKDGKTLPSKYVDSGIKLVRFAKLSDKSRLCNRQIGTNKVFGVSKSYNSENEFSIGIAYIGWFIKK